MGIYGYPLNATPPGNKALLGDCLDSHDDCPHISPWKTLNVPPSFCMTDGKAMAHQSAWTGGHTILQSFPIKKNIPGKTNMTIENQAFEDVSPIKHGDFPLPW